MFNVVVQRNYREAEIPLTPVIFDDTIVIRLKKCIDLVVHSSGK
jgi:hypothetical protein